MTPQELKNSILQLAIQGKLVEQRLEEGTAADLYKQIQAEKQVLIKAGKIKKEKPLPEITEEEKPFDIPESWLWVRLGSLLRVIGGVSYDKKDVATSGLRILRGGNIQQMKVLLEDDDVFLPEQYRDEEKAIREGDILIVASTGSKAVIGKAGYVDRLILDTMIGAFLRICRSYSFSIVNYLRCLFDSDFYRKHIRELSQGTNINNVKESYITEFAIPLPPLAEQKRIVAKIEELLPLIERYEKAWSRLEDFNKRFPGDMQKSILQMAIQGKLVEQRSEEGTGEELYQQIQAEKQALIKAGKIKKEKPLPEIAEDEYPFEIPESWKWVRFADLYRLSNGTASRGTPGGTEHPVLRLADLSNNSVNTDNIRAIPLTDKEYESHILQNDDLIFIRVNGSKDRVASAYHYKDKESISYCDHLFCGHRTSELVYAEYIMCIFNCQSTRKQLLPEIKTTAGQNTISQTSMAKILLPLPPLAEQKRIVARLEELLPLCDKIK